MHGARGGGAGGAGRGAAGARRAAPRRARADEEDKVGEEEATTEWVELKDTFVTYSNLPPMEFGRARVAVHSKLGRRKYQEDRFVVCPRLLGRDDLQFYGVFDGTVGDFTSDYVHTTILLNCVRSLPFRTAISAPEEEFLSPANLKHFEAAMRETYRKTDEDLLAQCREHRINYSASTSVTALLTGNVLTIGHLADSRIVLGREEGGRMRGIMLTHDHKPDQREELARIEAAGGSLTYLHGGKPFIRGGDFVERQARGDRPMQLNYSRAFGAKDLKCFGLSPIPDVAQIPITDADKLIILGSDGVWDVVDADTAVRRAWEVMRAGGDPSQDLVDFALHEHDMKGSIDNVTALCVFFK
mmetsp:Transcript_54780/g.132111  ORF Transcript_54780/g.132111 Transcript_54780/m.132111 type:complete len:357 (+) Transcript_54780:81-1151(+)